MTNAEVDCIKARFKEIDANADGLLDLSELSRLLRLGKPGILNSQIRVLFDSCDKDGSGLIDFEEFVDFVYAVTPEGDCIAAAELVTTSEELASRLGSAVPSGARTQLPGGGACGSRRPRVGSGQGRVRGTTRPSSRSKRSQGSVGKALSLLFDALDPATYGDLSFDQVDIARELLTPLSVGGPTYLASVPSRPKGNVLPAAFERWALSLLGVFDCPSDQCLADSIVKIAQQIRPPFFPMRDFDDEALDVVSDFCAQMTLFLTSVRAAAQPGAIAVLSASHLVQDEEVPTTEFVRRYTIDVADDELHGDALLAALPAVVNFIHEAVTSAGRVLVCCGNSISLGPAVVIAYMVAKRGLSLRGAFEFTRRCRPVSWPNVGFMRALIQWEHQHSGGRSHTIRDQQYQLWSCFGEPQHVSVPSPGDAEPCRRRVVFQEVETA
eukprot:TRINITY_DN51523_c0_g1_i1.p1 TRINITY_DN51523_c0_g1~~TRINITY_DN51523_c0_g1_i1.p1  ORF type:complete len:438 (+),score=76.80 TRINITY_DN51523_c0_g1_i1:76-1389(+)